VVLSLAFVYALNYIKEIPKLSEHMKKIAKTVIVVLLGLATIAPSIGAANEAPIEIPLLYVKYPDQQKGFYPFGALFFGMGGVGRQDISQLPKGEWKLPELVCAKPLYGLVKFDNQERLVIADTKEKGDNFYNRLFFDANGNKDLTDDPIIIANISSSNQSLKVAYFPAMDMEYVLDGVKISYSFKAMIYNMGSEKPAKLKELDTKNIHWRLNLNCCYQGELTINDKKLYVTLGDTNCNGRFGDQFTIENFNADMRYPLYSNGDYLYLSKSQMLDHNDGAILGDQIILDGICYNVKIDIPQKKMALIPKTGKMGELILPTPVERIALYTEDELHLINAYFTEKSLTLPQGSYKLLSYSVIREDEQTDKWRLNAAGTSAGPVVVVSDGQKAKLAMADPFIPLIDIPVSLRARSSVRMQFNVEGAGKELVSELSHFAGNKTKIILSERYPTRPKEPMYKILSSEGEVIEQGSFEYG
jgi:hypothetical protein